MCYVVYNKVTTRLVYKKNHSEIFETLTAAKAGLTRHCNSVTPPRSTNDYAIAETVEFYTKIEKKETVRNLMSGTEVEQSVNTPNCLDVSSETYWSM